MPMQAGKTLSYNHQGGREPLIGEPIATFLLRKASANADHEALVSVPQKIRWSYGELFERIDRLARALMALGVERGDRVGIWAVDNAEWVLLHRDHPLDALKDRLNAPEAAGTEGGELRILSAAVVRHRCAHRGFPFSVWR